MSAPKMGGPAFAHGNPEQGGDPGMTLWDYYAAAALPAVIAAVMSGNMSRVTSVVMVTEEHIAQQAAEFADAMLAERAKRMKGKS